MENIQYCEHYQNLCDIYAQCCDKYYNCRRCHNEENSHELIASQINKFKCKKCNTTQDCCQRCINDDCNTIFGEYYCSHCRILEKDDVAKMKGIFHCDECGICRLGGRENSVHCKKCACCLLIDYAEEHKCTSDVIKKQCCICLEDMFNNLKKAVILKCGHAIHEECLIEHIKVSYRCPLCYKSIPNEENLKNYYEILDMEIATTPMPEEYADKKVSIQCFECGKKSETKFHIFGHKCNECGSYNTVKL